MGTRNVTMVVVGGDYRVAQYCQWDGYPEGQGANILSFLRSLDKTKTKSFIEKVKNCKFITPDQIEDKWVEMGATKGNSFVSMDIADKVKKKYPELSRDTGSDILKLISESENGLELQNSINFVKDSLFCEWAYVIDFDENTFEIFRGFNKEGLAADERFSTFSDPVKKEYEPVKAWMKFSLKNLPTRRSFLSTCIRKMKQEDGE